MNFEDFLVMISLNLLDLGYRKIPKISPGAYLFQRPFLYTWTCALSLPILVITILIARIESLRGPGRIICMGPYGPKTTKADDKEFY